MTTDSSELLWKGAWCVSHFAMPLPGTRLGDRTSKMQPIQDSTGMLAVHHAESGGERDGRERTLPRMMSPPPCGGRAMGRACQDRP